MSSKEPKHPESFGKVTAVLARLENHYFTAVVSQYFYLSPQWKKLQHVSVLYVCLSEIQASFTVLCITYLEKIQKWKIFK